MGSQEISDNKSDVGSNFLNIFYTDKHIRGIH